LEANPMKYDENHIQDFEGAKGTCSICGLDVILDWRDKPTKPLHNIWIVKCPHCSNDIRCSHDEKITTLS
jgi:hypothetical protein